MRILALTRAGMVSDDFDAQVPSWLAKTSRASFGRIVHHNDELPAQAPTRLKGEEQVIAATTDCRDVALKLSENDRATLQD
jgi:hypothetical protein